MVHRCGISRPPGNKQKGQEGRGMWTAGASALAALRAAWRTAVAGADGGDKPGAQERALPGGPFALGV